MLATIAGYRAHCQLYQAGLIVYDFLDTRDRERSTIIDQYVL